MSKPLTETVVHQRLAQSELCKMGRLWKELDQEDRDTLGSWISHGIGYRGVRRGLGVGGHIIGLSTVEKHLNGSCCCDSAAAGDPTWRRGALRGTEDR